MRLLDRLEAILSEPVGANGPVVTLDIGVLLGLAGLDVGDADPEFAGGAFSSEIGAMTERTVRGGTRRSCGSARLGWLNNTAMNTAGNGH